MLARSSSTGAETANLPANSVWQIPLVGLSDNITDPWGINITTNGKTSPYIIVVSKTTTSAVSGDSEIQPGLLTIGENNIGTNVLDLDPNFEHKIIIGNNTNISISTSSDSIGNTSTPTVPFGLNLGHDGSWNGSLVFGGDYDANRVAPGVWNLVNESANGNGTFLTSGEQSLSTISLKFASTNLSADAVEVFSAIIDINSDAIILPSKAGIGICKAGFSVVLNAISGQTKDVENVTIAFPSNLTAPSGRCATNNITDSITLGRPFFQAAYVYVDTHGQLWFNPARQNNLPPNPLPFDPTKTLQTITSETHSSSSSSTWDRHTGEIIIGTISGVIGVLIILCATLCLLHKRRQKKKRQKDTQQEIDKLQIQILRDEIEENINSPNGFPRATPPPPTEPFEPTSVFESDDEGDSTVLKRTKRFLKSLKGEGTRKGYVGRDEGFDKRVVVQAGRISPRDSRADGPENAAWSQGHTTPRAIEVPAAEVSG